VKQISSFSSVDGQRGDALLEALFGIVLMAIIGLGLAYASARATSSQRYLNTQNIAISGMREQLMNASSVADLCANNNSSAIKVGDANLQTEVGGCQQNQVTVSVAIGSSEGGNNASASAVQASVTLVTSLTLATTASNESAAAVGGDGRIIVGM
jgi:prepilin peptidase dependent protein A